MPPPRGEPRCGGGLDFVSATAIARAALFLPTTPEKRATEIAWSMPARQRRWQRGATARSNPVARRHRAIAARAGFSISRTVFPAPPEMAARTAAPDRSAFRARTSSAPFGLSFSLLFLSCSPLFMSGKSVKQKTHDCFGNRGF